MDRRVLIEKVTDQIEVYKQEIRPLISGNERDPLRSGNDGDPVTRDDFTALAECTLGVLIAIRDALEKA